MWCAARGEAAVLRFAQNSMICFANHRFSRQSREKAASPPSTSTTPSPTHCVENAVGELTFVGGRVGAQVCGEPLHQTKRRCFPLMISARPFGRKRSRNRYHAVLNALRRKCVGGTHVCWRAGGRTSVRGAATQTKRSCCLLLTPLSRDNIPANRTTL